MLMDSLLSLHRRYNYGKRSFDSGYSRWLSSGNEDFQWRRRCTLFLLGSISTIWKEKDADGNLCSGLQYLFVFQKAI